MNWVESAVVECHGETHTIRRTHDGWASECGDVLGDIVLLTMLSRAPLVGCQGIVRFSERRPGEEQRITGILTWSTGTRRWYRDGKYHRDDGPAVENANGDLEWIIDGVRHREGGPAMTTTSGQESWWANGKLHRVDGPAYTHPDGSMEWWFDGKKYSKGQHDRLRKG